MSELPKGWSELHLKLLGMPSTPNIDPSKFPDEIFELYSVPAYANKEPEIVPGNLIHSVKQLVQPGDVLLCKIVPHLNRVWIVQAHTQYRQIASGEWIIIRSEIVDNEYLRYKLSEPTFRSAFMQTVSGVGGSLMRARPKAVAEIQLAVAPRSEQRRIVAKLNNLFSRSRCAREELERIPKLIERYKQSVLAAAFRGDLTADWRQLKENLISENAKDLLIRLQRQQGIIGEFVSDANLHGDRPYPSLPSNWSWAQVEDIGQVFLGRQRSPKNHNGPNMRLYVRAANITWNGWDISDIKEMNFDDRDFQKYKLQPGDVLINEGSGSADEVGKPAIWNNEIENCCFQNTLICVRPFESMSQYLYFVFLHAARSKTFVEETRGVNIFHIGKERLSKFKFALPPITEQKEIVQRIEKLFKAIALMEQEYQKATKLLDRLEQTTLSKAFRGELVPQHPDDEPASVLLERILAEREGQPTTKRSRAKKGG